MPAVIPGDNDARLIEPEPVRTVLAPINNNTAHLLIQLDRLRNDRQFNNIDGSNLTVVVIDSGLDATHPALIDNFTGFIDFTKTNDTNPPLIINPSQTYDISTDGHGTLVSGIIGATDLNIGVAPEVGLIGLQIFDRAGESGDQLSSETVERSLRWVLANKDRYNITVVNLSLAKPPNAYYTTASQATGHPFFDEVKALEAAGITVVAAAGNNYQTVEAEKLPAPAIYSTLAVGAVWSDDVPLAGDLEQTPGADKIAYFSQRLDAPNMIFAPGVGVVSTFSDDRLGKFTGTSSAAPHVTGAVALVQDAALEFGGELLTPQEVAGILRSTAKQLYDDFNQDDTVRNTFAFYPRLDIYGAIVETQRRGYEEIVQYGASYSDLIVGIGDQLDRLAQHYREFGRAEGRSRDNFDEFAYLAANPDVLIAFGNNPQAAALHYIQFGYDEGRSLNQFKADEYLASYSDLILDYGYNLEGAASHYFNIGATEGRAPDLFNAEAYLNKYADLQLAFGNSVTAAVEHYIRYGYFEGRTWF